MRARLPLVLASLSLVGFVTATAPSAQATPTTVVVPNANATVEGNGNNVYPLDCGSGSMRYQQVYAGSQVGSGSISQLAFRDGTFLATTIPGVTITLSTTAKAVTGLSTTFANNVGSDVKTVFSGDLTLSGAAFTGAPGPFDIVIPLQTPFTFNPSGGNLLLDVTIPTCERTSDFDADTQATAAAVIARVYSFTSTATSGQGDSAGFFAGLVTQFTFGSASSPCMTGSHGGSVTLGAGSSCVNGASIGGNLTVPPGTTATITNSTIGGSVSANGAASVTICGSKIGASLSVTNSTGPVVIGSGVDDSPACVANTVGGKTTVSGNAANAELGGNTLGGSVQFDTNTGTETSPEVEGNTIGGALGCSGNNPSVSNGGQANSVSGSRTGQCVGF